MFDERADQMLFSWQLLIQRSAENYYKQNQTY